MPNRKTAFEELLEIEKPGYPDLSKLDLSLPPLLTEQRQSNRARLKAFPGVNGKHPMEVVSWADKGLARKHMIDHLKKVVWASGLPYVHLWYYPNRCQSLFSFRIDSDGFDRKSFYIAYELAEKYGIRMTWFIDVMSHKDHLENVRAIGKTGQEIQPHCYQHVRYTDRKQTLDNLGKALAVLKTVGVGGTGFAAPFGTWTKGLATALEELGLEYSSEFSFDYDDLPLYPLLSGRNSRILQIPIHPIGIGALLDAEYDAEEMKIYFRRIMDWKYAQREPIILYGHPAGRIAEYPEVLDFIFTYALSKEDIWYPTFREIAHWWRMRENAVYKVCVSGERLKVETAERSGVFWLRFEQPDGQEAFLPLEEAHVDLSRLSWSSKPTAIFRLEAPTWRSTPALFKKNILRYSRLVRSILSRGLRQLLERRA